FSVSSSSRDRKRKQRPAVAVPPAQRQVVPAVPVAPQHPVCAQCGRRHGGECFRASGKCFNCGEVGHKSRECPKLKTQPAATGTAGRLSRPARVFAVTAEEAQAADDVTEGTILIDGFRARILFDSGATDSFISACFAELLCNQSGRAIFVLSVPL